MERYDAISKEEQAELDSASAECRRLDDLESVVLDKLETLQIQASEVADQIAALEAEYAALQPEGMAAYAKRDELWEELKLAGQEIV